jgi:hypothetical protein
MPASRVPMLRTWLSAPSGVAWCSSRATAKGDEEMAVCADISSDDAVGDLFRGLLP